MWAVQLAPESLLSVRLALFFTSPAKEKEKSCDSAFYKTFLFLEKRDKHCIYLIKKEQK